jgi:hypothetical protein
VLRDPHHVDADPDPACHFDADPDPTFRCCFIESKFILCVMAKFDGESPAND